MSGQWPPGWEDPEDLEQAAEGLDAETDVRLSEVTAFLAAVPAPVLPDGFESRILAALAVEEEARAAESTARAEESTAAAPEPDAPHILRPRPATRARVRRPARARRFPRINPAIAAWPLAACLFFAGIGYLVSLSGSSSSSSAPYAAAPAASSSSAASSAAASSEANSSSTGTSAAAGSAGNIVGTAGGFAVIRSGTDYQKATLAAQVRAVIVAENEHAPSVPSAASPTNGTASAPVSSAPASASASASAGQSFSKVKITSALHSCVVHLTDGAVPLLIDQAKYHGTPVYVIATDSRVWVVGLGCTAAHPDLIASAPLGG